MSSLKLVQRSVESSLAEPDESGEVEVAETGGVVLSDDRCVEHQGRIYVPPQIDASLAEALTLPAGRATASITEIVTKICSAFAEHGLSDQTARRLTCWAFTTWFPDELPWTPCLFLTGPRLEANLALQLLTCVVRHGLLLAHVNSSKFVCLPMHVQPTVLIARSTAAMWDILSASNYPRAYIPNKTGLSNIFCAKGVYGGTCANNDAPEGAFRVHLVSIDGKLPVIKDLALRKLAAEIQPMLLDYRMTHFAQVRDSDFDLPALEPNLRILARVLGSAIVDAPELRKELLNLMQESQADLHLEEALNVESIVVEALLDHSHGEQSDLYIGRLADLSNKLLKDCGSHEKLEPKAVGWIVRKSLGFTPKRNGKGFGIKMTEDVRSRIHQLALEFQVWDGVASGCNYCKEIAATGGEEEKPAA